MKINTKENLISYLLEGPLEAAAYRAPVVCGGGAATKAELPGLRLRFNLFLSRADNMASDSDGTTGVEGEGKVGVTERVEGEGAFVTGASGGHRSIGEDNGASVSKLPPGASADISTSISAANSLSRSISSSTPSRNPSPSLSIAAFRAFLTS